ncbi:unnamed protein product [Moneuplotes crassus]|uniref:PHR domain-containing protein n=2 Tax=Euplotes crassus TaxID=5936 RepID=A0AAD1XIW9_EUPCR|nr:unnamed protein product [Moneuplotes crassus]
MEKIQKNHYQTKKDLIWRATLDEDIIPFVNLKPSLKELTQEEMKKNDAPDQFNFSEANVFRGFTKGAQPVFNKDKLIYNFKTNKWFKVLDLKTDNQYNPTWASLSIRDGAETVEISKPEEFAEYKNTLKVFINVNFSEGDSSVIEVNPKIYEKFETAFENALQGVGAQMMSYKFFFNGKEISKDDCIANLENVTEGSTILASEGLGKPSVFKRFPDSNPNSSWSNSGRYCDGLAFIPNQNIRLSGFTTFASSNDSQYEMRYTVDIGGTIVEEDTVVATGWEEDIYYRHKLKGIYQVQANQKFEIIVWIAKSLTNNDYVSTYSGNNGYNYADVENEHMGLFKIEQASKSDNGTSVYGGHFPEIFYYLG